MQITNTHLVESNEVASQSHDFPLLFSSVGVFMVCVGLICAHLRTRLFNRTTWKDKQHQQHHQQQCRKQQPQPGLQMYENQKEPVSRPLPSPQICQCDIASKIRLSRSRNIMKNPTTIMLCNHGEISATDGQKCKPSDLVSSTVKSYNSSHGTNGLHCGKSKHDTPNLRRLPTASECVRPNRTFPLPKWVHKLIQYFTESRNLTKNQSNLSNGLSEIHKVPITPSLHDSTSGCSTGSVTDSQTSADSVKQQETSDRRIGFFAPWSRPRLKSSPVNADDHSINEKEKFLFTDENNPKSPASTHSATQRIDINSLLSDADFIDPVYSKIREPSADDLIPCEYDSVLDSDEWGAPVSGRRDSFISCSSEDSDHASAHIYHQLIKQTPRQISSYVIAQPQATRNPIASLISPSCMTGATTNPASSIGSAWSIRLSRQSPLRRVINCVIASQSTESMTCLCGDTTPSPPQLPARSYRQSTVNLVYRLRNLLRYKDVHQPNGPRHSLTGLEHNRKAATLTLPSYGSIGSLMHTAVTQSCVNMTGTQQLNVNQHVCRSSGFVLEDIAQMNQTRCDSQLGTGFIPRKSLDEAKNDRNRSKSTDNQFEESSQNRDRVDNFILQRRPPLSVQRSLNGSRNHLRWSDLTGSYGNIRHIDSEVDLLDTGFVRPPDTGCSNSVYRPPSIHIKNHTSSPQEQGSPKLGPNWKVSSLAPEYQSSRPITASAPTKSLICSQQTRTLMSPLMERSMEDDEVRHALNHSSYLPCSF